MTPKFDPKRRVGVIYTDDDSLPRQHRGAVTDTLYVFNLRHRSAWVDKRDLAGMVKDLGPDNLDGTWKGSYQEHKEKQSRRRKKEQEPAAEPEVQEVENEL